MCVNRFETDRSVTLLFAFPTIAVKVYHHAILDQHVASFWKDPQVENARREDSLEVAEASEVC